MLGERLRNLRQSKSMSQAELGEILNTTQQSIGNWERGRNFPPEETVVKIAEYFGVSVDYLFGADVPRWATRQDVLDLDKLLNEQVVMSFGGERLTLQEQQRVKDVLTGLFWNKLHSKRSKE